MPRGYATHNIMNMNPMINSAFAFIRSPFRLFFLSASRKYATGDEQNKQDDRDSKSSVLIDPEYCLDGQTDQSKRDRHCYVAIERAATQGY